MSDGEGGEGKGGRCAHSGPSARTRLTPPGESKNLDSRRSSLILPALRRLQRAPSPSPECGGVASMCRKLARGGNVWLLAEGGGVALKTRRATYPGSRRGMHCVAQSRLLLTRWSQSGS
jgi:hypothetical protein